MTKTKHVDKIVPKFTAGTDTPTSRSCSSLPVHSPRELAAFRPNEPIAHGERRPIYIKGHRRFYGASFLPHVKYSHSFSLHNARQVPITVDNGDQKSNVQNYARNKSKGYKRYKIVSRAECYKIKEIQERFVLMTREQQHAVHNLERERQMSKIWHHFCTLRPGYLIE